MRAVTLSLPFLVLWACQRKQDHAPGASLHLSAQASALDTAAAYRTAIADYIHAMDTTAAPLPDTVYIGRHAEFPRIELPAVIARRAIRIIDPAVGESEQQRAHFAYLNMIATFTPGQVEFYVVRFVQGLRHQPDGAEDRRLYYRFREKKGWLLDAVSR